MEFIDCLFWILVVVACVQQHLLAKYKKLVEEWESMFRDLNKVNEGHVEIIGKLYSRIHDIPYNSKGQLMERSELDRQNKAGKTQEETIEDILNNLKQKKDKNG